MNKKTPRMQEDCRNHHGEFLAYLGENREWLAKDITSINPATDKEVTLRKKKIKQLLISLEKNYYAQSDGRESIFLRREISRFRNEIELAVNVLPLAEKHLSNSQKNKTNASKKRKAVEKSDLIKFKDQFERDNGTSHGWIAKASRSFKIDRATIKKRIAE